MNVQAQIDRLRKEIKDRVNKIKWLRANGSKFTDLPEACLYGEQFDFDNLPHAEVIKVVRAVGGKWTKTPGGEAGQVHYETVVDGVKVRCYNGKAPPSCKVIEVEEHVPAQIIPASVRKVRKLVCQPELAAKIATVVERHEQAQQPQASQ